MGRQAMGLALAVGLLAGVSPLGATAEADSVEAAGDADPAVEEIAGEDRWETSSRIATEAFDASDEAVIASGEDFADALAGVALAGALEAPVLLVPAEGALPAATEEALSSLGVRSASLVGGEAAISEEMAEQVEQVTGVASVDRVAGEERYSTAAEVAARAEEAREAPADGDRVVFLATGLDFPDTLAIAPASYAGGHPILLADGGDALPEPSRAALEALDADRVIVAGGEAVVSAAVTEEIEGLGIEVTRAAGRDRYETAVEAARLHADELGPESEGGFDVETIGVSSGTGFADALSAAPFLAREGAPLVLTPEEPTSDVQPWPFLRAVAGDVEGLTVLGGTAAVPEAARQELAAAAGGAPITRPRQLDTVPSQGRAEPDIDWRIYDDAPDDRAELVRRATEEGVEEVRHWLGLRPDDFTVVVSDDPETIAREQCDLMPTPCDLESTIERWQRHGFEGGTGAFWIRTSIDWWDQPHLGVDTVRASRARDVAHELLHVIRADYFAEHIGRVPQRERREVLGPEWLHSGMAMFLSAGIADRVGRDAFDYAAFAAAREEFVADADEPSLEDLQIWEDFTEAHPDRPGSTDAAYAAGFLASEHLVFEHGSEAVTEFYTTLDDGVPAPDAFEQVFGQPLAEFEEEFSYPEVPR